jgi:hypothetical protein
MYKSEYFEEKEIEKKNTYTSAALTVGIILTVIVGIALAAKCIVASGL